MKINLESQSKMVLKDNNYTFFLGGLVFFLTGIGILLLMWSEGAVVWLVGSAFALGGAYLFLTTKAVTATLDKEAKKCSISMSGIMKKEAREAELGKINGVVLQTLMQRSHSSKRGTRARHNYQYILKLVLEGGEELRLEFGRASANITDVILSPHEAKRREAQRVASFLGVPFSEERPPTLGEAVSAVKGAMEKGMSKDA